VVLTAGTFLNGLIHVGLQNYTAGRAWAIRRRSRWRRARSWLPVGPAEDRHAAAARRRSIDFSVMTNSRARSGAGVQPSSAAASIRASCRAGSRRPTSARTTSSAPD
jgi:tRNA U34 5-carboxymethylaminomethyl modifying enzyme MnmG/GidA